MAYREKPAFGAAVFLGVALALSVYFMFAAVQGDYGVLKRAEVDSERLQLEAELESLMAEIQSIENRTRRLSDAYLDLDLLDQQARNVLGMVRADEIVVH